MAGRVPPTDPGDLVDLDGIVMRSTLTGRVRHPTMRDTVGGEMPARLRETIVVNDPAAIARSRDSRAGRCSGGHVGCAVVDRTRRTRAIAAAVVRGRRDDFDLLRDASAAAGENTGVCRFRCRGVRTEAVV